MDIGYERCMNLKGFCFLPALCLLLAVPAFAAPAQFPAVVIDVADGDMLTVLTKNKLQVKIRLYGIECPESEQAFNTQARQAAANAVLGKTVTVQPLDTDRYGWVVGIVFMPGGSSLCEHLVRNGLAWVYARHCKRANICVPLWHLELEAKRHRLGLWKDKAPVPPWEWRKEKRRQATIRVTVQNEKRDATPRRVQFDAADSDLITNAGDAASALKNCQEWSARC